MSVASAPSYVFNISNQAGVVAANNFMTLVNPASSGKVMAVLGVFISTAATGASASTAALKGSRATAVSGGTLRAASTFTKSRTAFPDAVAEVRTGNPSATVGTAIFASPAPASGGAYSSGFVHAVPFASAPGGFLLAPGEGIVLRTDSGDTAQRWNISIFWSEK